MNIRQLSTSCCDLSSIPHQIYTDDLDVKNINFYWDESSDTNLATNLPDLATKWDTLATRLGIWNLAIFLVTCEIKIQLHLATNEGRLHNIKIFVHWLVFRPKKVIQSLKELKSD